MGALCCCCKKKDPSIKVNEPAVEDEQIYREATVLVVGNIAVGKTTLINCLI